MAHQGRFTYWTLVGVVMAGFLGMLSLAAAEKQEMPRELKTLTGTIESVNDQQHALSVNPGDWSASKRFRVSDDATIRKGSDEVDLSDLRTGEDVTVRYVEEGGESVAKEIVAGALPESAHSS
ncbi:MAG TPA: hypothetical protein VGB20_05535 [bacterium]